MTPSALSFQGLIDRLGARAELVPQRVLNRALAGALIGSVAIFAGLVAVFFTGATLGDDYEYFLPLLLAGKYFVVQNGLAEVPRFTPAFCGGLPLLANPQSIFYSLPQALAMLFDPVASAAATIFIFSLIGAASTYALMRRRFGTSVPASALSAVLFLFNGFMLNRVGAGHLTYHVVGLFPLMCLVLLRPRNPARHVLLEIAGPSALAAAMLAYMVYAGAPNLVVPLGLAAIAVWLIHALLRPPVATFWLTGMAAAAIAAATSAAKLFPAAVLLHEFPRTGLVYLLDSPVYAAHIFAGFFFSWALPDHIWLVGRHEFDFGIGIAPLLLLLAAYSHYRARPPGPTRSIATIAKLGALTFIIALPPALSFGPTGYAVFLKSLPYVGDNAILLRWFAIYLMPLVIGAGLALDYLFPATARRTAMAVGAVIVTVVPPLLTERPVIDIVPYDPAPVRAAIANLRATGAPPTIAAIGGTGIHGQRNDALVAGASSALCYEPLFGYQLQSFPPGLNVGLLGADGQARHLRNPACYIYGRDNQCTAGDTFTPAQRRDEAAFAAYRTFAFTLPEWQRLADRTSLAGLGMIGAFLLFGAFAAWRRRRPSS
jgi:hypothetical protein